jgi:DNA-binding transcriptional MerR regulator
MAKDDGAFLTIGELAQELGVAQHILRYWETRFSQLRPLQRSGNRRYYRPGDVDVARAINRLLNEEGFTVRGAQRVLSSRSKDSARETPVVAATPPPGPESSAPIQAVGAQGVLPIGEPHAAPQGVPNGGTSPSQVATSDIALLIARLTVIRQNLVDALESD